MLHVPCYHLISFWKWRHLTLKHIRKITNIDRCFYYDWWSIHTGADTDTGTDKETDTTKWVCSPFASVSVSVSLSVQYERLPRILYNLFFIGACVGSDVSQCEHSIIWCSIIFILIIMSIWAHAGDLMLGKRDETRMHSSRMRTARLRIVRGGGVLSSGGCSDLWPWLGGREVLSRGREVLLSTPPSPPSPRPCDLSHDAFGVTPPPPPVHWQNDKHLWKHNLRSLRYVGCNNLVQSFVLSNSVYWIWRTA